MRIYDYLNGILGALGVGDDNGVPTPAWRIEEYLEAIYEAIKAGGGGGGTDITTFLAPQFSSTTAYSAGDYVVKSGNLYRFTEDHAAGAWTGTDAEQTLTSVELEALYAALSTKANVDGSYSTLTAGNAEQLVSTVGVEESTPYLFRTTGGSADVGDRVKLSEITGGTVAWNQTLHELNSTNWGAESGVTASYADGVATISSTTANNGIYDKVYLPTVDGHKYLVNFESKCAAGIRVGISVSSTTIGENHTQVADAWERTCSIKSNSVTSSNRRCYLLGRDGTYSDIQVRNAYIIDLTAMFGSTIADYLYTLESGTAGAGVAKLKSWGFCTKPYYAYNDGTLLSVKTSAHREIGFNQWDEEWELGYYNINTGASTPSISNIRCKNKIKVVPNTTYYIKTPNTLWILEYDADDIYLNKYISKVNQVFTTSANTQYIRFYAINSYGTTYKNDICINLHWDGERDGEYEPYEANTYPLDSDLELRGIPKLDANNNLYYDGDSYAPDGTVTRRYGIVDLGTLNWQMSTAGQFVYEDASFDGANDANGTHMICSSILMGGNAYDGVKENVICARVGTYKRLWAKCSAYQDAAAFKTAMNGVYLVYGLATPTTESADPYQETQICNDFGTEEFIDSRTVPMPVGYNAFYQANLRAKLEMAPDSPSGNGDYIVRQMDGLNEYVLLEKELPTAPAEDGTYSLKCVVADGAATLSWVSDT